jgi:hypothetical protein
LNIFLPLGQLDWAAAVLMKKEYGLQTVFYPAIPDPHNSLVNCCDYFVGFVIFKVPY